jgi:hypothetical protein
MTDRLQLWLPRRADITANVVANAIVGVSGAALAAVGAWVLAWLAAPTSDRDWVNYFLLSLVVFGALWLAITIGWRRLFPLPTSPTNLANRDVAREVSGARPPFNQAPVAAGILEPTAKPLLHPKHPPSTYEIEQTLKASDALLSLLNDVQDAISFTHEIKHKAITPPVNPDQADVQMFDLGRCRDAMGAAAKSMRRFHDQNPQHSEFGALLACPANSVVGSIERFRTAYHRLSSLVIAASPNRDTVTFQILLQPFISDLDIQLQELADWKQKTSDRILKIRRAMGQ